MKEQGLYGRQCPRSTQYRFYPENEHWEMQGNQNGDQIQIILNNIEW